MSLNSTFTIMEGSSVWSSYSWPATIFAFSAFCFTLLAIFTSVNIFPRLDAIIEALGLSFLNTWPFFSARYDFMESHFKTAHNNIFKFKVLHHSVYAARGEIARKVFFDSPGLDFKEGYKVMRGGVPELKDISEDAYSDESVAWFNKQLFSAVGNKTRLNDLIPSLFSDLNNRITQWGTQGTINPFDKFYDLVFQITARMASCAEFADDLSAVQKLQDLLHELQYTATPTALLFPWFPSSARKRKEAIIKEAFTLLMGYVQIRKAANVPSSDTIDHLLKADLNEQEVVGMIMGIIFAGLLNTGISSSWSIVYLGFYPEWKGKVTAEVNSLIANHTVKNFGEPLHKRLSTIPLSAWENEMPVVDLVIRETLRLVVNLVAMRRNLREDVQVNGEVIAKGDFMAYPVYDAHLNPEIYDDPLLFDPARFLPGREEDKKGQFSFLGWGAGRHPCTGIKIAKLEMKIILALFIAGYDYEVVDRNGKLPKDVPRPDHNNIHYTCPAGDPCYIKFKKIVA